MQKTEVTQAQWAAVWGSNPSFFRQCGGNCPVESVSWEQVQTFLSQLNSLSPGITYRLPTEAEWEYAARATTTGDRYGTLTDIAWYVGNSSGKTHAVAGKQPNLWGLYDMIGNVAEWVQDWFGPYPSTAVVDPTGPVSSNGGHIQRGTYYLWGAGNTLPSAGIRVLQGVGQADASGGFRLVRVP
jgi:formylglycine-generating enzyme required for sulfatase activity